MSKRGDAWMKFANKVYDHIETYTVPQYGDEGEDQITNYSADDCVVAIKKYANRFGTNQRVGQEKLDFMKIAHYSQCAHDKLVEGNFVGNTQSFIGVADEILDDVDEYIASNGGYGKAVKITVELI